MLLLELNNDCLDLIFQLLPLKTQITTKKVCHRFQNIIKNIWQRDSMHVSLTRDELVDLKVDSYSRDILEYISIISDVVVELSFEQIDVKQFRLLKRLRFPRVKTLQCKLWNSDIGSNDEDILLIAKLFPALTKLTLLSSITGKYLWLLEHLVDLDLSSCESLKTVHLAQTFRSLKLHKLTMVYYGDNTLFDERIMTITACSMLEELNINEHHLSLIIDAILRMPTMRKITCYTVDYDYDKLLTKIAHAVGERMETIIYNDALWSKHKYTSNLMKMPQLRKLVLHVDVEDSQLLELSTKLHSLREIHITKGCLQSDEGVLSLVENCPQLQLLDVAGALEVNADFLKQLICTVEQQPNRWFTPLQVCCFDTAIVDELAEHMPLPNFLWVSRKKLPAEAPYTRYFVCEWRPKEFMPDIMPPLPVSINTTTNNGNFQWDTDSEDDSEKAKASAILAKSASRYVPRCMVKTRWHNCDVS